MTHSIQTQAEHDRLKKQVAGHYETFSKLDQAQYMGAAVSATMTIGPGGAHLQGWITYLTGGEKVHFKSTKISDHGGIAAGVCTIPVIPVLNASLLDGKTTTFSCGLYPILEIKLSNSDWVFIPSLYFVGPALLASVSGTVKFTKS